MTTHSCPTCEARFETERGLRVHHGRTHDELLPNRTCAHCGTEFHCPHEKRYCSDPCRDAAVSMTGSDNPNYRGGKATTSCELCGTSFEYYPSEKPGLYCPTCVDTRSWRAVPTLSGAANPRWTGGKQTATCVQCGEAVERWPSGLTGVIVCSDRCRHQWLAEAFAGEAHPNWTETETLAYGPGWDRTRRRALDRDDHRCQLCGADNQTLGQNPDVHHIIPVRRFVESDAHSRTDAHSLANVIALCRSCHRAAEAGEISRDRLWSLLSEEEPCEELSNFISED